MIRYAGLFSNPWKQQYLSQARASLNQSDPDDSDENVQSSWAERQTEYTGIDPLICPNCNKSLIFVGAFFGNWNELQYLFDKAGKDSAIPTALLRPGEYQCGTLLNVFAASVHFAVMYGVFSPRRRLYPPACKPYGLEAEPEAATSYFTL